MLIEISIVLAGAESSVFLLNEKEWGGLGGLGLSDFSRLKMFVNKGLTCFQLLRVHGIGFGHFRDKGLF